MRQRFVAFAIIALIAGGAAALAGRNAQAGKTLPDVSVKPSKVNLGRVPVGSQSLSKSVTITNNSGSVLYLNSTATNNSTPTDFGFASQGCSTLQVGASCISSVVFHPTAAGRVTDAVWTIWFGDQSFGAGTQFGGTFTVNGVGLSS